MSERRNVPEIAIGFRELLRRPKLGSISSLRCQKSRTRVPWDATCEVIFRGRCLGFSQPVFALRATTRQPSLAAGFACGRLAEPKLASASEGWWSQTGSNRRPHACKARALPAELWPRTRRRMHLLRSPSLELRPTAFFERACRVEAQSAKAGGPGKT